MYTHPAVVAAARRHEDEAEALHAQLEGSAEAMAAAQAAAARERERASELEGKLRTEVNSLHTALDAAEEWGTTAEAEHKIAEDACDL